MEYSEFLVTFEMVVALCLFAASQLVFPSIVWIIASNSEGDKQFIEMFRTSLSDKKYPFTDQKIRSIQLVYRQEFLKRRKKFVLFFFFSVVIYVCTIIVIKNPDLVTDPFLYSIASVAPVLCIVTFSYLAGVTAASRARLKATKPIQDWQAKFVNDTLKTSQHAKMISAIVRSNPKKYTAEIDYIYIKYIHQELEKEH